MVSFVSPSLSVGLEREKTGRSKGGHEGQPMWMDLRSPVPLGDFCLFLMFLNLSSRQISVHRVYEVFGFVCYCCGM